jgi:rhodanese-related sulfurtransferase
MKLQRFIHVVLLVSLCCIAGVTAAMAAAGGQEEAQPDWFFHDLVDADFVKQHMAIPMPENVMIIDARPFKPKYIKGHIPMAVSIPNTHFDKLIDKLPANKDALLIFYCEGPKCKLSHKSAAKAEALGYKHVKVFAEGFPGWLAAGNYPAVSTEWVKKQMDDQADMTLIDSRPKRNKYDKGHIPGAISLPDTYFDKMKDQLPPQKDKLLVFYCEGFKCKLSHKSAQKAMDMGYTNVKVYAAGYPAWKAATGDAGATAAVSQVKAGKEEGSIDIEYFKKMVAEQPDQLVLIDVRDADEFAKASLKTSTNIPIDNLEDKIKTLPDDKPIVFICGTGARSGEAFYMVQDVRPALKNVYYIEAEITFKKDGSFIIKKSAS